MGTQIPIHYFLLFAIFSLFLPCFCWASLPVQFSITGYAPEVLESENLMTQLFQEWRDKQGKIYEHDDEMLKRFDNFKQNLKYVIETNSNRTGFTVDLNRFADLSNSEFREKYFGKLKRPVRYTQMMNYTRRISTTTCYAPPSLDWRKKGVVSPVKNQGQCGSCWAFSTTGAMESINAINTGELIRLSEQELVDCDSIDDGCDGGEMQNAFEWIVATGGIDTEDDYPYTGVKGACIGNKVANKVVSIDGYENVERSESALLCAVVNQPIAVGLQGSSFDFQLYSGGIYDGACSSSPLDVDHAVLIVGYGSEDGKDYWIVKNSWGTSWGMNGYMHLRRNTDLPYGVCAVNFDVSYPTQIPSSPSPYPSPSSPPPPYNPPSPPPPSPPSPFPSICGDFSYCPAGQTCCCIFEFFDYCLMYGCCEYTNAVCCDDSNSCCPHDYPVCDTYHGLCLKESGDYLGVAAKKKKLAKHKLPWSNKIEPSEEMTYEPLQWKRNMFAATR